MTTKTNCTESNMEQAAKKTNIKYNKKKSNPERKENDTILRGNEFDGFCLDYGAT